MWHREGRKMAIGQCRSAISFDDVAQKTTLARSAHQNNSERTSKLLEEQCHEFVSLVSVRFRGLKKVSKQSTSSSETDLRYFWIDDVAQKTTLSRNAQHGHKMARHGPEMVPSWPRYGVKLAPGGLHDGPQRPQGAPRKPQW